MHSRPIIGVPACRRMLDPHPFHMVGEKYLQALVVCADALPVIIPALASPGYPCLPVQLSWSQY